MWPRDTELWPLIDVRNWFLLNILRMDWQNFIKFCIHFIIEKIYVAMVKHHFCKFATELQPLIDIRNWFLLNILRKDGQNLTKFCIHIIIDKIYICIVKHLFSQTFNRVTALNCCQKLVFAQYLENGWTEFNPILYTLYHWQDLCCYSKASFFANLQRSYSPWLMSEIGFCSISWESMDRLQPNFVYTWSSTRSILVL